MFFCYVVWCPRTKHSRPFRIGTGGRKIPESSEKYYSLIGLIVSTTRTMYPGWRIRIYHNVTRENNEVWGKFCDYFCREDILDLCDVNSLPAMDKWNSQKPHGMFWRMQPLGDPTVLKFQSRDLDGYLTERVREAVDEWEISGKQFHIMRDHPNHGSKILGGLWGGSNYMNFKLALKARKALYSVPSSSQYGYDLDILERRVWPLIRCT